MIRLAFVPLFAIALISSCSVTARTRKKAPVRTQTPKLIEATMQRTLPGRAESSPFTTYRMLLLWNSPLKPETFFWRPEGDQWMTCGVSRVRKQARTSSSPNPAGLWYTTETIRLQDIRKGDTLELTPLPGGRDIMPASVKKQSVRSIYYYTEKGGWQTIPVASFRKLPNLIMP